jgi:hypothetical protein
MPEFGSRRGSLLVALAVLIPALAACSSVVPSSVSSWLGSKSGAADSNASAAYKPPANFECPSVTIRRGAGAFSLSANSAEPSASNVRYQFALGETARECQLIGPTVSMKVGVRGRVVRGPAGAPGQLDVPLRFAVVREGADPQTVVTKFHRLAITMPPNDANVPFSYVEEELSFPMPPRGIIDSYVVYVGFDPQSAEELDRKKPAPRSTRSRHRS